MGEVTTCVSVNGIRSGRRKGERSFLWDLLTERLHILLA